MLQLHCLFKCLQLNWELWVDQADEHLHVTMWLTTFIKKAVTENDIPSESPSYGGGAMLLGGL